MVGREGATFGPYRLTRRLGAGGAGEVYRAEGPGAGVEHGGAVALKILTGGAQDVTTRAIAQQAHTVSTLPLPHVVPIYAVVEAGSELAVAMALAPGGSLGDTLSSRRADGSPKLPLPLAPGVVARLVTQLAHALGAVHAQGLAHGDLKPNNLFVRTSPSGAPLAAVSDFGQSVLTTAAASLAASGSGQSTWIAAQLLFAAPEQLHGETLPASDQYALAAIAYFLLTGEPPFVGDAPALLSAIARDGFTVPSSLAPMLSGEIDGILARALAKRPDERFVSIEQFARALDGSLAVGVSATNGLTQQFARLAASTPGAPIPRAAGPGVPSVTPGALRVYDNSSGDRADGMAPRPRSDSEALEIAAPRMSRRLGLLAGVAVLLLALACVLGFQVFASGALFPHIRSIGGGANHAATVTPNATEIAQARAAATTLSQVQSSSPAFSDALLNNSKQWRADGSTAFFAPDGLHLRNHSTSNIAAVDAPGSRAGLTSFASQVDVALVGGLTGDQAGMRFLVQPGPNGKSNFYCYLVSVEGHYSIWMARSGVWTQLSSGYSTALRAGFNQTNTLTVLVTANQRALFFANKQYVTALDLPHDGVTSGNVGLMVLDGGAEARFTHLMIYNTGQ
ncbi:MAG TPA: serine/threonine-protein kinase [Ktedonobacterales bacterium]|nr:serine/threonine-protein kinase [Ktedonobacterales bacterium]